MLKKIEIVKKGSVTVYLCLTLVVMLSLIVAALYSAKIAAGRTVLASAAEQGMFSLFSQYERPLFDDYGLLFLDAGYGSDNLQLNLVADDVQEAAEYIVQPNTGKLTARKGILDVSLKSASINSYILATDHQGAAFSYQVSEAMKASMGKKILSEIVQSSTSQESTAESLEQSSEGMDSATMVEEYEKLKNSKDETSQAAGDAQASADAASTEVQSVTVPADFKNPIEAVKKIQKLGIYSTVITDYSNLSDYSLKDADFVSSRALQKGIGYSEYPEDGIIDKALMAEYVLDNFSCYTDQKEAGEFRYQIEYAISGGKSDLANLKSVLNRLILMREASNMAYLLTSSTRRMEAEEMAMIICTALLIPEAVPAVTLIVEACWAYGESLLDLRELLSGGKVPLVKTDESWQLQISSLAEVTEHADSERKSSESGLDYKNYLRLLLLMKGKDKLTAAGMDLTEYEIRKKYNSNFRLDSCVQAAEVTIDAEIAGYAYTVSAGYDYDENYVK